MDLQDHYQKELFQWYYFHQRFCYGRNSRHIINSCYSNCNSCNRTLIIVIVCCSYVKVTSLPSDPSWVYVICVVESILTDPTLGFETTESVQVSPSITIRNSKRNCNLTTFSYSSSSIGNCWSDVL